MSIQTPGGEPRAISLYGNTYMFTGRAYDTETGLYYYRARYYYPYIGRFMQPDPIGYSGGMNLYIYVGNNPVILIDPWGLCAEGLDYGNLTWWDWTRELSGAFLEGAVAPFIDVALMPHDYYGVFREAGLGPVGAGLQSANMTAGKILGYGTLSEGIVGVDVRAISLTSGWQRAGQVGLGAAQTAVSAVLLAEALHTVTASSEPYGSTPEGRPLTYHYGVETGPARNIPGSVVDNTINNNIGIPGRNGTVVYYDPINDVTVVK